MNTFVDKLFVVVNDVAEVKQSVDEIKNDNINDIPNVFYKYNYKIDIDGRPTKATIPICKADSPCFQCKVLTYGNGGSNMLYAIDALYLGNYPQFGFVSVHKLNSTNFLFEPNASLMKITTTNDEEIICIRLEWNDGSPVFFDYTIIANQVIAGDDIEIKEETQLPKFEFYPILKDAKKNELSSQSGEDIATEGAVVKYVNGKITELESTLTEKITALDTRIKALESPGG